MKLQEIRKKRGYSQSELSLLTKISVKTIQKYEIGERNIDGAKLETLCDLAIALDVDICDIIESPKLKAKIKMTMKKPIV